MATSPVLYVYYRPDNDDSYPGVPNRHITEADWASFTIAQRRTIENATTQEGYTRRKVWVHRDLVDETEQERADREAAEQAAREAYDRANSLVRYGQIEAMIDQLEVLPPAEEFVQLRADVDAVADVPPRVEAVEQTTERLDALTYDVERFIPAAATRADAWQSAIDTAFANGGGTVTSSLRGMQAMSKGLALRDQVHIDAPAIHLDFTAATVDDAAAIVGRGTTAPLPALAASIAKGATTLAFSTAPDLAPGDLIQVRDSADGSFSTHRASYRAGEFCRVAAVSGATVTLATPTYAAYASGGTVTVVKVRPIRTGVRGLTATFPQMKRGLTLEYGADSTVSDCILGGSSYAQLTFSSCYNVAAQHIVANDYHAAHGYNYGIVLGDSQRVAITDCFLETTRHGMTTGGEYPNRDITVTGGVISSTGGSYGADTHGNIEYIRFTNVVMPTGISIRGDHVTVEGCTIRAGAGGVGRAIDASSELVGVTITIRNNTVTATREFTQLIYLNPTAGTVRDGVARITGNIIDANGFACTAGTTNGVVTVSRSTGPARHEVVIAHNEIINLPSANTGAGINLFVANGTTLWSARVLGNRLRRSGIQASTSMDTLEIAGNEVQDAPGNGIGMIRSGTPGRELRWLRVLDNSVERAGGTGMLLDAYETATRAIVRGNVSLNNVQGTPSGNTSRDSSLSILRMLSADVIGNTFGDDQAAPTQSRAYGTASIATLRDLDTTIVGTLAANRLATGLFRGSGAGAPTFACADGSVYLRTDGGAGSTFYVREGGAWVAK